MVIAETQRLILREMHETDAESAYLLNSDPAVIKFTGDKAFESVEDAKQFLVNYDQYKKYGLGRWCVVLKNTNEYLGWCGLKFVEELNEYDLGYRFMKKHWNKGYATESALASLDLGFNKFKIETILGHAELANIASIRVLEKIGFTFLSSYTEDKKDCVVYHFTMNDYMNRSRKL